MSNVWGLYLPDFRCLKCIQTCSLIKSIVSFYGYIHSKLYHLDIISQSWTSFTYLCWKMFGSEIIGKLKLFKI
jgi:hypothetical protein